MMDRNIWSVLDRAGNFCFWTPHTMGFNCSVLWQGVKSTPCHQDLHFASHCWETLFRSWLTLPLGTTVAGPGTAARFSKTYCNAITTKSITLPSPPLLSELLLAVRQKLITRELCSACSKHCISHRYLVPCQEQDPSSFVTTFLRFLFPSPQWGLAV